MTRIAIIDADTDVYQQAARSQVDTGEEVLPLRTIKQCLLELTRKWSEYCDHTGCDTALLMFTHKANWRTDVFPEYKANRKDKAKPILLNDIRMAILNDRHFAFTSRVVPYLEADDLCGITQTYLRSRNISSVCVSQDKDLLTIPGVHWNPRPTVTGLIRPPQTVTTDEAFRNHMSQTLTGDTTDNYPGAPGIGAVKALTLLNKHAGSSAPELWQAVVSTFIDRGVTEEHALTNARVARILHHTDYDKASGKVTLWTPPV